MVGPRCPTCSCCTVFAQSSSHSFPANEGLQNPLAVQTTLNRPKKKLDRTKMRIHSSQHNWSARMEYHTPE